MKTIGIISDTHIPARVQSVPKELLYAFEDVDCIIHAGDITSMDVIDQLGKIAPVHAVCGNMDDADVQRNLPAKKVIEIDGKRIGITHGAGSPFNIKRRVVRMFADDSVDCIVFGHTHKAEQEKCGDILLLNPGSPTDKMFSKTQSFALLTVGDDGTLSAEIITF